MGWIPSWGTYEKGSRSMFLSLYLSLKAMKKAFCVLESTLVPDKLRWPALSIARVEGNKSFLLL